MLYYIQIKEREVNTMLNMIKAFAIALIIGLSFGMFVWFIISYIDVFMHNLTQEYNYPNWNIFTLFF